MSTAIGVVVGVVVVLLLAGLVLLFLKRRARRRQELQEMYGPEYDRAVQEQGSRSKAERELAQRHEQRSQLEIRPLDPQSRQRYQQSWQQVQARFVDDPQQSVSEADDLVTAVMRERGYPTDGFDEQARLLSVDHANTLDNYRQGHHIAGLAKQRQATTEQLRQGMMHYRSLFTDLVEDSGTAGGGQAQPEYPQQTSAAQGQFGQQGHYAEQSQHGQPGQFDQHGQHGQQGQFGQPAQHGQPGQFDQQGQPSQFGQSGQQHVQQGQFDQQGQQAPVSPQHDRAWGTPTGSGAAADEQPTRQYAQPAPSQHDQQAGQSQYQQPQQPTGPMEQPTTEWQQPMHQSPQGQPASGSMPTSPPPSSPPPTSPPQAMPGQGQQPPMPGSPQGQDAYPQGQSAYPQGQDAYPQGQSAYPQGQDAYPQGQSAYPQGQSAYPQGQGSQQPMAGHPQQGQDVYPQGQNNQQPYPADGYADDGSGVLRRRTPSGPESEPPR